MKAGEIDGYQFAVIEATGLIAVRRPDGSLRMLPGAAEVENAVKTFIREEKALSGVAAAARKGSGEEG
jgi:hypothetical protein